MSFRKHKASMINTNNKDTRIHRQYRNNNLVLFNNIYQVLLVVMFNQVLQIIIFNQVLLTKKGL